MTNVGSLHIQSVLFRNDSREIYRLLEGLEQACVNALTAGVVTSARMYLGDCSPNPCLSVEELRPILDHQGPGISSVEYEYFNANLGSALGHNRLSTKSDFDQVMIINPDTYPAPNMIIEMMKVVTSDERIGIVEARQVPLEHPKAYDVVSGDTSWSSTCCIITPRSIFEEQEGFDHEHFPLYCDDVDYSWRVRMNGHRVVFAPRAVIVHDKRLHPTGGIVASEMEQYSGALARLMLAAKYSRKDIEAETIAYISTSGTPPLRRALEEFERRRGAGSVPEPLEAAAGVAQFIGGAYAAHRF